MREEAGFRSRGLGHAIGAAVVNDHHFETRAEVTDEGLLGEVVEHRADVLFLVQSWDDEAELRLVGHDGGDTGVDAGVDDGGDAPGLGSVMGPQSVSTPPTRATKT